MIDQITFLKIQLATINFSTDIVIAEVAPRCMHAASCVHEFGIAAKVVVISLSVVYLCRDALADFPTHEH